MTLSRKFTLTLVGLSVLLGFSVYATSHPGAQALYPTFVGGLLGVLTSYHGANVLAAHVASKAAPEAKE